MNFRTTPPATLTALAFSMFMAACSHDLDENTIRPRAEGKQIQLESEQVSMTSDQLNCGIKNDLWEDATSNGGQQTHRLMQKGRDLQFSDDVYSIGGGYTTPYTQLRGKFYLQMRQVVGIKDGSDGSKLIQARLSVKIPHECFTAPLPLMAVAKGKFTTEVAPTLKYENTEDGWRPTEVIH